MLLKIDPIGYTPPLLPFNPARRETSVFHGRRISSRLFSGSAKIRSGNNPVPNHASSWDAAWAKNYGGYDDPNRRVAENYIPVNFTPRQNPFYCALPYNDKAREGHRPEAPQGRAVVQGSLSGARAFRSAKTAGSRSAKATAPSTRSGRMPVRSAPIIGNTFSETNARNRISTAAPGSMFRRRCAIISACRTPM